MPYPQVCKQQRARTARLHTYARGEFAPITCWSGAAITVESTDRGAQLLSQFWPEFRFWSNQNSVITCVRRSRSSSENGSGRVADATRGPPGRIGVFNDACTPHAERSTSVEQPLQTSRDRSLTTFTLLAPPSYLNTLLSPEFECTANDSGHTRMEQAMFVGLTVLCCLLALASARPVSRSLPAIPPKNRKSGDSRVPDQLRRRSGRGRTAGGGGPTPRPAMVAHQGRCGHRRRAVLPRRQSELRTRPKETSRLRYPLLALAIGALIPPRLITR